MTRTFRQQMSDAHEADIAEWIGGRQQKASGSQWHAQMDVINDERTPYALAADGKATMKESVSVSLSMWRKAVEQTFGKIPTLWLRFYKDESLREVDLDLVVIERREFLEILEAARNWEGVRQEIGYEGVLEAEVVVKMLRGDGGTSAEKAIGELSALNPSGSFRVMECSSGCDCCR